MIDWFETFHNIIMFFGVVFMAVCLFTVAVLILGGLNGILRKAGE